jgi:hypothetical protein
MLLLVNQRYPITFIKYLLPEDATITIKIFDILGEEVMTLLDRKFRKAGEHSMELASPNLPSGVYIYDLEAGANNHVRRMVQMNGHRNGRNAESLKVEVKRV